MHATCTHALVMACFAGVSFKCADLLTSDLSNVGVLMLTEQCWDKDLIDKVRGRCLYNSSTA